MAVEKRELLVGTVEELTDHFCDLCEGFNFRDGGIKDMPSKASFIVQLRYLALREVSGEGKGKLGRIFLMKFVPVSVEAGGIPEMNIELAEFYVEVI